MNAKQTPLVDMLGSVPTDIVLGIPGDGPFPSYTNIPIGTLARDAAAELRRLHADAKRYHWILRHYAEFHGAWTLAAFQRRAQEKGIGPGLDGAIDAAIAAEFADVAVAAVEEGK